MSHSFTLLHALQPPHDCMLIPTQRQHRSQRQPSLPFACLPAPSVPSRIACHTQCILHLALPSGHKNSVRGLKDKNKWLRIALMTTGKHRTQGGRLKALTLTHMMNLTYLVTLSCHMNDLHLSSTSVRNRESTRSPPLGGGGLGTPQFFKSGCGTEWIIPR